MKEMVSLQASKNFISFHLVFVMMNFFDMKNTSMLHHCRYEYMVVVITSTCAIGIYYFKAITVIYNIR
jgi:magnesium-transporting ATPase (P-type)